MQGSPGKRRLEQRRWNCIPKSHLRPKNWRVHSSAAEHAYKDYQCYGGLTAQDFGKDMPKEATNFLRPKDIEIVVDWLI